MPPDFSPTLLDVRGPLRLFTSSASKQASVIQFRFVPGRLPSTGLASGSVKHLIFTLGGSRHYQ
ncbi:UNVERIFIED_CONTAM: hypothetical protein Sangu_2061700 [Sesamum angustifolium]|uniref:Uncharacterized protein n=1 Tax=Sesamum angustifolium TaxID=2727405 RepID=A0AAW2LIV8_9LAMI